MTKIQKATITAITLYILWEISIWFWAKDAEGAIIRVDLLIVYPILIILIGISTWQKFRK
ncbi:MAG: hypothetical protein KAH10_08710 [Flavobacteriales bacterium]|nr:hypothetical protein [Flavobacteriales bacterium]